MRFAEATDGQRGEEIRGAVARDAYELAISVSVSGSRRCVVLGGCVATNARRSEVEAIARRVVPDFEIQNCISVAPMELPRREELP